MVIKKSELYSFLWKSCDELRGGMDASQYKDYVLVLLFVKYVSDKYAGEMYASIVIPEGGSFKDMVAIKGKKDIGEGINKIIAELAEANRLKGVIDVADFDNADKLGKGKEMVDRLSNLVGIFQNESRDFSKNKAEGDDILGDAYEYLMRHFATESGKSKGQFYTPAEVSRVIAKVIGVREAKSQDQTIYDPTCGSGSLLLKAADETHQGVTIYGQEMDNATAALAKMNMILHGNPTAEIWQDNTLSYHHFKNTDGTLKTFDFKGKKDEWDSDLLPKQLVINRYFAAEQKAIEQLEADCDAISRHKEAMEEEHSGEDGLLEEVKNDKGKISKGDVQKRIKDIKNYADAVEELGVLEAYLELIEIEVGANKKIKDAQKAQDKKVIDRYKALTEDEVKTMVVGDKWMATISHDVNTEVEHISQRLTQRIKELAERYATPMPELNTEVDELEAEVSKHLEKMGFVWT